MANSSIDLSGKTALITGASRGIGAAVAKAYAKAGAHVILLARTQGALEEVDDEIRAAGGSATLFPYDLSNLREINKIGITIAERFGALDILVCNAGAGGSLTPIADIRPKEWEKVMAVNFFSHAHLIRSVHALLLNSSAGRAIFTTTTLCTDAPAYWGLSSSSKMALHTMALTYAAETTKTNIRVNLVSPGTVQTKLLEERFPGGYPGEMKQPEDVVGPYLELAADDCTRHGEVVTSP